MKKRMCVVVIPFIFLILLYAQAESAVVNFDDSPFSTSPYAGFTWPSQEYINGWQAIPDSLYTSISYQNTYGSVSGDFAASNQYGATQVSVLSSSDFNFTGAFFTSWAYQNKYYYPSARAITVEGYNNGAFVGRVSMDLSPSQYDFLTANLLGVDELRFIASNPEYSYGAYWLMDDFTYTQASAVPIPPTVWLLGAGLVGLAGLRRKFFRK